MTRTPPIIDMTPQGAFVDRQPVRVPFSIKLAVGAVLVAAVATALTVAAAALWVISILLPVIVIAGGTAWLAMKWRRLFGRERQAVQPRRFGE